jgi:transposase
MDEIARIYQLHRDTIGTTFERWENNGIEGLFDEPRSGRPPKLSDDEANEAVKLLKEEPRSIKQAQAATREKTGKEISEWTLKRIARRAKLRWKRMRKSVKGNRDQAAFERAKTEIATLHEQEAAGLVAVYYFDESGFSLTPEVPYAWQTVGEIIEIPSRRSQRLNVLGFCNKQQDFHATTVQGYVDSARVIAAFDQFCSTINKRTVVIVDNASMHTSDKFKGKLGAWERKGLTVKYRNYLGRDEGASEQCIVESGQDTAPLLTNGRDVTADVTE